MANEDYKNGKLVEIVREFNHIKGTTRYEINGITQSIAVPFWREEEGKFKAIPKGSYKFISESGNNYLEITDETILQQAFQFQIVYVYSQISSKYVEDFPELSVLTTKYNELVDDATKLFSYLKSVGMISDTFQMTKVLSPLEPMTTWYMDEKREIKALPISELYVKFNLMIEKLKKILADYTESKKEEIRGATFFPHLIEDGTLSWTNDKNKPNPEPVNIKGPAGTIENVTASVNSNAGTPKVIVSMSGTKENRSFNLEFQNLKGDPAIKGKDYYTEEEKQQFTTEMVGIVKTEGNKVVEQVKSIVAGNPATTNALTLSGKTRVEFEQDTENLKVTLFDKKSDLSEIVNRYNMINPANIVRGTVNMSGVIQESEVSNYDVIKYIPVEAGKTYGMSHKASNGGRTFLIPGRIVFYNTEKHFVEQATSTGEHTNFITVIKPYDKNVFGITTKSNGYLCFQVGHGLQEIMMFSDLSDKYSDIFTRSLNAKLKEQSVKEINLSDELKNKFNAVNDVNGIMSEVINGKDLLYNLLNPVKSILGALSSTGDVQENSISAYYVSDFILLKANTDYNLSYFNKTFNGRYNLSPSRWCFYDTNNKVFKNQSTDLTQNKIDYIEETVKYGADGYRKIRTTQDVYMRIQYGKDLQEPQIIEGIDPTYVPNFSPSKKYALKDKVVEINNLSDELKNKIEIGAIKTIDDIYRLAFCKVHKNVLCIGDSLTEGYHNPDDIRGNMSYPSHMSSLAGYTVKNMGQSGITALGWWNAYKEKDTFTKYDAVFIYLGTNGGLTDTIDEDTASGDYNTFAQTNTGGYCAIIAKIKAVNPKCKIYLIQYNNVTATSKVTAKIAKKYGCITLLVTDNSVFNLTDSKYHTDATHYNSIGYWAFACVMLVQVEKYIASHVSEYVDLNGML